MNFEVIPALFLCSAGVIFWKFKTEVLNFFPSKGLFGVEPISKQDELFIARKLAGLLKY